MNAQRKVDRPLRRDVRLLGEMLGQVLMEQEGAALLDLEEKVRKLAIRRRRGPREGRAQAAAQLGEILAALPPDRVEGIIRAFSVYFQLVNLAEQHHRIRRARTHALEKGAPPQRGSLEAVLREAKDRGVPADHSRHALADLEVTLTFTAHPTQAMRRTVLEKLYRIAHRLEERDRCTLTPKEAAANQRAMREEISALWLTDELRRERPTVGDEVKNVLWYLEEILWDLLPWVGEALEDAFERAYGEPVGFTPNPLRLHSWVGGDMDGHPLVTPEVLEDAVRAYANRGVRHLLEAAAALGSVLSESSRHVRVPEALTASLADDARRMPAVAAAQGPRTEGEPWRRKLRFVEAKLAATLRLGEHRRREAGGAPQEPFQAAVPPYGGPAELEADLELIADTLLEANAEGAGVRQVQALRARVRALGFMAAELEMRVLAVDAREAWSALSRNAEPKTPGARRVIDSLRRLSRLREELGDRACRTLILSMASSAEDVRAAFHCAKACGLWEEARGCASVNVVPLLETLAALDGGPAILGELFADPEYRAHLSGRGVQEVMVGYSDSGKEVGLLAASAALYRAQTALPAIARAAGIPLRIFHGRGESVARGGGPAQQGILALPPGSVGGRYKATEQGEALDHKYARPELAMRTLELIVGGALLHSLDAQERPSEEDERRFLAAYDDLAELGRKAYRAFVWENPRFPELFRAVTPVEEIAELPMGSRPAKRGVGGLESLRAIPWVFAWTQNRAILPGWYGVGTALETFRSERDGVLLIEMYRHWPFFRSAIDNVEMVLAKSDLAIAERYMSLAPEPLRELWQPVAQEHRRTAEAIKWVTGHRKLLDGNAALARSISLRNPYVDPMSFLQVELLRRKRAGEQVERPLLLTLAGIASGMRNTG